MKMGGRGHHALSFGHGYTVVEVMIFLAITSALFVMVVISFQGQQGKTQFTTSARDMESRVQDIINDVATGFPGSDGSFRCTLGGGKPQITAIAPNIDTIGTNTACIYIGKVLQPSIAGDPDNYAVYPIVGLRQIAGSSKLATSFAESQPIAIAPPSSPDVDLTDKDRLPVGVTIARMTYDRGGTKQDIDGIGFFSTLGSYTGGAIDTIRPGALSVYMVPLNGDSAPSNISENDLVQHIDDTLNYSDNDLIKFFIEALKGSVVICMNSDSSNQHAVLKIGGDGQQLTTDLEIFNDKC
ncbi:MAG TPA: hypothetical protein VK694_02320 [Verrucomicrobiae bacterium]|nr:hypothetical protein [Verrucomicrobiae bacterium]